MGKTEPLLLRIVCGTEHNYGYLTPVVMPLELQQQPSAVDAGHHQIKNDEIRWFGSVERMERFIAGGGNLEPDSIIELIKSAGNKPLVYWIIVHDENSNHTTYFPNVPNHLRERDHPVISPLAWVERSRSAHPKSILDPRISYLYGH